jgi:hypothetical protein
MYGECKVTDDDSDERSASDDDEELWNHRLTELYGATSK